MSSSKKDKVAVAILNWNGLDWLKLFLPTVISFSKNDASIYVIDNNSSDESVAFINDNFPEVKTISLNENHGFAGGYNKGLEQLDEEYCVLLNSDVEVTPNWINPIIDAMEKDKHIAACQPKIKAFNDKNLFEYAGAAGGFIDKYGYPFCRGRVFDTIEEDKQQYNDQVEIFWATGACMFVRKKAFLNAGQFDMNFFAHMEEIDLCWRMKNKGDRIMYIGSSTVYHVGGGTLNKSNPKKTFLNFRNSLLTLYKNLPKSKTTRIIFIRLLLDGLAGVKFLLQGNIQDTLAIIRAHFSFYSLLKQYKKSRVDIYPSQVYSSIIVIDYYLKAKKKFSELTFHP